MMHQSLLQTIPDLSLRIKDSIGSFKGGDPRIKPLKRETMFVQLLEGLVAEEAELLVLVKDGKLNDKYKRITKAVVSEAYPSIEWGGRS